MALASVCHEDLVRRGVGQLDLADGDGVRGGDDGLTCVHGFSRRGSGILAVDAFILQSPRACRQFRDKRSVQGSYPDWQD